MADSASCAASVTHIEPEQSHAHNHIMSFAKQFRDMMDPVNDLRYAARMLLKTPGFTVVAVGLLAAGIGASTVIFSAVDAVFLRPLPVRHPEELVRMVQKSPQLGTRSSFSYLFYQNLRDHASSLATVFGEEEWDSAMNEPSPAEEVKATLVTPEFFDVFGVAALHGRALTRVDATDDSGTPAAVLSYAFWSRRFNADPGAVGRTITLHGHKFIVVGVMPREFNGVSADTSPDVRVPLRVMPQLTDSKREGQSLYESKRCRISKSRRDSGRE